jgi:hypothetical protein
MRNYQRKEVKAGDYHTVITRGTSSDEGVAFACHQIMLHCIQKDKVLMTSSMTCFASISSTLTWSEAERLAGYKKTHLHKVSENGPVSENK